MAMPQSRYVLLNIFFLFSVMACSYQRPAGKWIFIDASTIYFAGVELDDAAIDPNYVAACEEARDEINAQLIKKLPAKIAPLTLNTAENADNHGAATATLKIKITRCEMDVDQSGGSFSYYLTLPLNVSLTQNKKKLLRYNMNTYEQVNIDNPAPEFEFTFAEPVARTLLLFNGRRLWLPDN